LSAQWCTPNLAGVPVSSSTADTISFFDVTVNCPRGIPPVGVFRALWAVALRRRLEAVAAACVRERCARVQLPHRTKINGLRSGCSDPFTWPVRVFGVPRRIVAVLVWNC